MTREQFNFFFPLGFALTAVVVLAAVLSWASMLSGMLIAIAVMLTVLLGWMWVIPKS